MASGISHVAPLVLGAFAIAASHVEAAADVTNEQLKQQIQVLQERLDALEAAAKANGQAAGAAPAATTAHGSGNDVDEVLVDAERRSGVTPVFGAGGGLTAGYDKGFFIKSEDGNFLLKPSVQFQFRYIANYRDKVGGTGAGDDFEDGFEVRRARFRFDGNAFTPKFTYSFVWDTSRSNGGVTLLDAWAQYAFAEQWAVRFGQFKESVFHEKDVAYTNQLAVDRSLADALLGGNLTDRVQGVGLVYGGTKDNPLRAEVAFHDGANSKNTNFEDGSAATAGHWGVGARGEYKVFGDWADYKDFTAEGGKKNLLVFGAGADYTDRRGADVLLATVDAQWELANRVVLYAAFHGDYTDPHGGDAGSSRFDWGALGQVGYVLTKQWEIFGRYDVIVLDDNAVDADGGDNFHEITVGVNYYLGRGGQDLHRAKLTLDATYLPNGAPSDQTQVGILAAEEDEFVLRAQLQLLL
jgi:hypothetical protein